MAVCRRYPFIHLGEERQSSLSKETTRQERLEPRTSRTGAQGVINHLAHTPPHGRKHLISKKLSSFNNEQILYQSNFQGKPESNSNLIPIKRRFAIRSVGKPIYHTHLATHRLINLGIVRESSFNMTRVSEPPPPSSFNSFAPLKKDR